MHCPAEIATILLCILQTGLMRIRTLAWQGRAELCAIESDHIHNIPNLIMNYSPEKLFYYWDIERPEYIRQVSTEHSDGWDALWRRLGQEIEVIGVLTTPR
ncbi:MAG: hypothetical protein JO114_14330 [Planctomycetaceae bacterium]|nr:hypothetical protein [Planctomycetaceae bacterium]MBV8311159.1 hypothetical protein [Planctomycetaceae bacterium]